MTNQIVNLTKQLINQKIDEIINDPYLPYFAAFSAPHLRQELIVRVLNLSHSRYALSEEAENNSRSVNHSGYPSQEESHIENLIRESILQILQEEDALSELPISGQFSSTQEPSHWFG